MSLKDLEKRIDPRKKPGHCPDCGTEGEPLEGSGYRCTNDRDECGTMTWIET